jgi:polyisoprenoid-binding protein YceI
VKLIPTVFTKKKRNMKNLKIALLTVLIGAPILLSAQRIFSRNANVSFDATSNASLEEVEAKTNTGNIVIDAASGAVEAAVLMKSFQFKKALMGEHFNENYVESSKYPKAAFKGKLTDANSVNFTKDGTYKTTVSGNLTMHGVTKPVSAPATITVKGGKITAQTDFTLALTDYNISIPSLVADKVAKVVKVSFGGALEAIK